MRLFVVEATEAGPEGNFMSRDQLEEKMQQSWEGVPTVRALDRAFLASLDIAHVGQVLTWRAGWVFCAQDEMEKPA